MQCHQCPYLQNSCPGPQAECRLSSELVSICAQASALPTHELEVLHRCVHTEIIKRKHRENNLRDFRPPRTVPETAPNGQTFWHSEHKSSEQLDLTRASANLVPIAGRERVIRQDAVCIPSFQEHGSKVEPAGPEHEASDDGRRIVTPDPWDNEDWCLQEGTRVSTGLHQHMPANCMCATLDGGTSELIDAPPAPWRQARPQVPPTLSQASITSEPEVILGDNFDEVLDWSDGDDIHIMEVHNPTRDLRTFFPGSGGSRPAPVDCRSSAESTAPPRRLPNPWSSVNHMSRSWLEASACSIHQQGNCSAQGTSVPHDYLLSTRGLAGDNRNVPAEIDPSSEQNPLLAQPAAITVQVPQGMVSALRCVPKSSIGANSGMHSVLALEAAAQRPEEVAAPEPLDPPVDGSVTTMNGPGLTFADMHAALQALVVLGGRWRDGSGSIYKLSVNSDGTSLNVQTKRPNKRVLFTKSHIHLECKDGATGFRIVWGHKAAFMLMRHVLEEDGHCSVQWAVPYTSRQPFEWTRINQ